MLRDSKNCRDVHFGPFSPHKTLNVWCCRDCGRKVAVPQMEAALSIQLKILDLERAALAVGRRRIDKGTGAAPPAVP
jgi:hypothetical protein